MKHIFLPVSFLLVVVFSACRKTPVDPNEGELITTFKLEFTDNTTGAIQTFVFRDLDGEGGNGPSTFDDITLSDGKKYTCKLILLNESVSPVDNVTGEIEAEGEDHQFYLTESLLGLNISDLDEDAKGLILGINSIWTCNSISSGNVNIVLKHKPGYKGANDPITIGDTDISLDFKVKIQ